MTEMPAQSLLIAAVVGLLSGTHAAIWGMYKDAIHEGFTPARFARSVLLGGMVGVVVQVALRLELPHPAAIALLFGLAYAAERGVVEVWKTFVREENQAKYFIPMQFSVRGVPVANRRMRLAAGGAYVVVVVACFGLVAQLDRGPTGDLVTARVALLALLVGSIVALGGAWKDAPKEGFEVLKFFRSPFMTVVFALLLSRLTDSYLQATVAALGYERAAAETYKTFFFPSRPRGKFAGKPILYPQMLVRRRYFVPAYVAICAAVLALGAVALRTVGVTQ
jgi:hypothetical protein